MTEKALREIGENSVPIVMYTDDVDDGDIRVKTGKAGEVVLDVTTVGGQGVTLSIGAGDVAHLIHLMARELARTEPLSTFVLT